VPLKIKGIPDPGHLILPPRWKN